MEQWSILSNVVNYILYDIHQKNFHNMNIDTVNKEKYKKVQIQEKRRDMYWN